MNDERLFELKQYIKTGLRLCESGIRDARIDAGRIAINKPDDTPALMRCKVSHDAFYEVQFYIKTLLDNFPELKT